MVISKRKLFKRKNRNILYHIYEDSVDTLASLSEQFEAKLKAIRNYKDQYKNSEYMFDIISKLEDDMDDSFYKVAVHEGQLIKSGHYVADINVYQYLDNYNSRLLRGIGMMNALIYTINYLESNELGVRSI